MSAVVTDVALRPEAADDNIAIRAMLEEAFDGGAEAALVERLRATGEMMLALVAVAHPMSWLASLPLCVCRSRRQTARAPGSRSHLLLLAKPISGAGSVLRW